MIQSLIILVEYLKEEFYIHFWMVLEFLFGLILVITKVEKEFNLKLVILVINEMKDLVEVIKIIIDFFLLKKKSMVLMYLETNLKFKPTQFATFFLILHSGMNTFKV